MKKRQITGGCKVGLLYIKPPAPNINWEGNSTN
jgi:hypothetical protein